VAYEDVERLRDALQRGEERVFSASLYLCLRSPTAPALDDLTRRVDAALSSMLASARPALYEMLPGLLSCLPAGQDHLGRCRNLETTSLATMIPFTSSHLSMERGILYGISVHNNSLVIFDPFSRELENATRSSSPRARCVLRLQVEALRALMPGGVLRHRPGGRVPPRLRGGRRPVHPFPAPRRTESIPSTFPPSSLWTKRRRPSRSGCRAAGCSA
jgi:hypothetical protein